MVERRWTSAGLGCGQRLLKYCQVGLWVLPTSLLWGCLIPIINTTFIELSTTDYLFSLSLLVSSWNSTSWPHLARGSQMNLFQCPILKWTKIKLRRWTTNPRKIPCMVMRWYWDTSAPGTRYSCTRRKEKPPSRCGLNGALPIEKEDCRKTQLSVAVLIRQVYNDVQVYKAQSQVFMREWIV